MGVTVFYSILLLFVFLLVDIVYGLLTQELNYTGGRKESNRCNRISKEMFEPAILTSNEAEKISKPSLSFWKDVFIRFRKNKLAMFGLVVVLLVFYGNIWYH